MTWQEAKSVARGHIARLKIPARLDGVTVLVTDYDDEDTLRFLKPEEPGLTLAGQRMINQAFGREMRKRGARVELVRVDVAAYFGWLGRFGLRDGPANRAQFISWLTCPAPKFAPRDG